MPSLPTRHLLVLALLSGAALPCEEARAEPFAPPAAAGTFDSGKPGWAPVAADFDNTGLQSWYAGGERISHYPRSTTPTLLPPVKLGVCPACTPKPLAFAVLDVDRDGDQDIARIVSWNGHSDLYTLQTYANQGGGVFTFDWAASWAGPSNFEEGDHAYQLAAGDYDRDGQLDLAVLATYQIKLDGDPPRHQGNLLIRWNDQGDFDQVQVLQSQHFTDRATLYSGDLDRDGDLDLMVDSEGHLVPSDAPGGYNVSLSLRRFLNDGDGVFSVASQGGMYEYGTLVDLTRDGYPDLFHVWYIDGVTHWAENAGNGSLKPSALSPHDPALLTDFRVLQFADLDEDGVLDLVTAGVTPNGAERRQLVWRRGVWGGTFEPARVIGQFAADITAIGQGDPDGSGDVDLLLRLADGSWRYVQNLAQRLHPGFSVSDAPVSGASRIAFLEATGDAAIDLVALQPAASKLQMLAGNGNGGFAAPIFKNTSGAPADLAIADFDRDGRDDIAYTVPSSGQVRRLVHNQQPSFFSWNDAKIGDFAGAERILAGNGFGINGRTDLLVSSGSSGALRWYLNQSANWSSSTVLDAAAMPADGLALVPRWRHHGDAPFALTADGTALTVDGYSPLFGWYRSAMLLQAQDALQGGALAVGQMDDDATRELVLVTGDGALGWWKPTDQPAALIHVIDNAPSGTVLALATADWTRDGLVDVLCGTSEGLFLYSRESGNHVWTRRTVTAQPTRDLAVADVNRDGLPDAAYVREDTGAVGVVRNTSQVVAADASVLPAGGTLVLAPGASGAAFTWTVRNPGRLAYDASIAVTSAQVLLRKAQEGPNGWQPGAPMSKAEAQQLLASVSVHVDGVLLGASGPGAVAADGSLVVSYNPALGSLLSILGDKTRAVEVRVKLSSQALAAGIPAFYVVPGLNSTARVLHDGQASGRIGTFRVGDSTLVKVAQPAGPAPGGDTLFSSGFEPLAND